MHGSCHVWPWWTEFNIVVLSCFTPSRSNIFKELLSVKPQDIPMPLFKAILYWMSCVRKVVNSNPCLCLQWSRAPHFSSVQSLDKSGRRRGDTRNDSTKIHFQSILIVAIFRGEQFCHRQGRPLFDVVHPAFPLPATTSPTRKGASWRVVVEKLSWCVAEAKLP